MTTPDDAAGHPLTVPAHLAAPLLRFLLRALTREVREDGGTIPDGMVAFMRELQCAADHPMSDVGPPDGPPAIVEPMATVAQVAQDTGFSARHLRRLAATGRIRARRLHARGWLIDPDSLKDYRQGV